MTQKTKQPEKKCICFIKNCPIHCSPPHNEEMNKYRIMITLEQNDPSKMEATVYYKEMETTLDNADSMQYVQINNAIAGIFSHPGYSDEKRMDLLLELFSHRLSLALSLERKRIKEAIIKMKYTEDQGIDAEMQSANDALDSVLQLLEEDNG